MDGKRSRLAAAKQKLQQYKREKQKTQEPTTNSHSRTNSCSSSIHNKSEESIASLIADVDDEENRIVTQNQNQNQNSIQNPVYNNEILESSLNLNPSPVTLTSLTAHSITGESLFQNLSTASQLPLHSPLAEKAEENQAESAVLLMSTEQNQNQHQNQFQNQQQHNSEKLVEPVNFNSNSTLPEVQVLQSKEATALTFDSPLTSSSLSSSFHDPNPPEVVPIEFYGNRVGESKVLTSFVGDQSQSQVIPPPSVSVQEQEQVAVSLQAVPSQSETKLKVKNTVENSTQVESSEDKSSFMEEQELDSKQLPNYIVDSLQKELSVLRKENAALASRESDLVEQLETSEKLMRDLRKEVNLFKQQGNVHQQLEELQQAVIVLSKSKMTIAEELNNEQDKNKELLDNLGTYENELKSLRAENSQLYTEVNQLKSKLEEELVKNQVLDDQRRHFSVLVETLQTKLNSVEDHGSSNEHGHDHDCHDHGHSHGKEANPKESHSHEHSHNHLHSDCHGDHDHDHNHDHGHSHNHDHDYSVNKSNGHGHSHGTPVPGHVHDDTHHHDHDHEHSSSSETDSDVRVKLREMEKTLKRLEWENATYEAELMKLAPLKQLEPRVQELQTKNAALKEEVDHLDHLVIQLQGENDTIGDYITLYQSQRLALREHAKENDQLVAALAKEKNALLQKLSELNSSVEQLARKQSSQHPIHPGQVQNGSVLEDKIRDLIVDVNSKVHETYSCSVCSGSRLMTV